VNLVPEDPGMHWGPIVVWVILALAAPTALLAGLWPLGPTVNRLLTDLVQAFN
jgi:hypothetical protein